MYKGKLILASAALLLGTASSFAAEPIVGRATVIDGDTIEIAGERIRFNGVDAPESWQICIDAAGKEYRCGQRAAVALDEYLEKSRPTRCEFVERDRYGRVVGNCYRQDGESVSRWLVSEGHAVDWARYSRGAYHDAQQTAQTAKRGIWQGQFEMPCEARARKSGRKPSC
ncbi:thermonuclease family protein [Rhizobium sp. ARZ01]|uniref:thermonuclease family protein n=1 Tax=Rhizobium sp. ARZ01 TaxID=2769313 RepID=UPI001783F84B|nr:thermonuclease family protein [Rhizobium sp. ARZ01]MBD9375683.1 thermonuclease family protein [Rhizobium sp. ARZ01]